MKILYLHQYFNTPEMPGGTRSYEMARRLVQYGHEVYIITSDRSEGARGGWYVTNEADIEVHWLPVPYSNKMSYSQRIRAFVKFAWAASRRAASISADVVFATSTPLTIAIPGVYASKKQHIPMAFEVRDLWPELPIAVGALKNPLFINLAKWLEKTAYKVSTHIVALSPGMAQGIQLRGIHESKITVIPNSSDVDAFNVPDSTGRWVREKLKLAPENPLIIYAGTFGLINGVTYLVDLAEKVYPLMPDVGFLLVGSGVEFDKIKRYASKKDVLNRNLWLWPSLSKEQMPALFKAATIATSVVIDLKPMWNNSANKFFDSLASGTPVAINYGGWQADILKESGAGLVLDSRDLDKAADDLTTFLQDKQRLKNAAEAARYLAETRFNRDRLARELEQVLLKAVNEPQKV